MGCSPVGPERWVIKRLVIAFAAKAVRVWERQSQPHLSLRWT